ncbi:hypothetical protein SLS53_003818 [Cytospora paraplurivora]|uniref:Alpha box domain-containing protein n=1 Tax=Cytospora paraplurivora TaxID=2898453 RepID=A0AAN9U8W4_9PEZI
MTDMTLRMTPAMAEVFGGPTKIRSLLDEQRKTKNGRVVKTKVNQGVRNSVGASHTIAEKKKGVNNFILFRRMGMELFRNLPQSERSPIIRVMWEQERHKSSWSLMARVWTFIRDHSEYDNIRQYLVCAIDLIRTVPPEAWLDTYKMALVRGNNGRVTLRQKAQPGFIRAPRDLSDFELLKGVVLRGLAVQDAEGLLLKMLHHSNHMMTVTTADADATIHDTAKADETFVNAMNYDPLSTFAELLGLPANTNALDFGVNVIDVEDVTNFDDSMVTSTGNHTHLRYQFDTTTAHMAHPQSSSLDMASQESNNAFDLAMPGQWQSIDGQMSQTEFAAGTGVVQDAPTYFLNEDFSQLYPAYDLL